MEWKIAKCIGTRPSALKEGLTVLFCSCRRQLPKLRKSRSIVSNLTLSSSKIGQVSQNSFVFKLADRQIDRQIDSYKYNFVQPQLPLYYTTTNTIYIYIYKRLNRYTSSTAQGGGGSFKNRKPIGEVGCCESRMAERSHWWTDRWLRSPLFLPFFLSFSDYLPTYLPIGLSMYLSIYLSI